VHVNTCEVLQCEVTLANELQPFGQVTAGVVKLCVGLKEMIWEPTAETPQLFKEAYLEGLDRSPVGTVYVDSIEDATSGVGCVWAVPIQWSDGLTMLLV
jgi:hypothetical protein